MAWAWGAAEGWTFVGGSADSGFFLKPPDPAAAGAATRRVTVRIEHYPGAGPLAAGEPASTIMLEDLDCTARSFRIAVSERFAGPQGTGQSLQHEVAPRDEPFKPAVAGSLGDRLMTEVCGPPPPPPAPADQGAAQAETPVPPPGAAPTSAPPISPAPPPVGQAAAPSETPAPANASQPTAPAASPPLQTPATPPAAGAPPPAASPPP